MGRSALGLGPGPLLLYMYFRLVLSVANMLVFELLYHTREISFCVPIDAQVHLKARKVELPIESGFGVDTHFYSFNTGFSLLILFSSL